MTSLMHKAPKACPCADNYYYAQQVQIPLKIALRHREWRFRFFSSVQTNEWLLQVREVRWGRRKDAEECSSWEKKSEFLA